MGLTRERGTLLKERIQHTNRIRGLLSGQGIRDYEPLKRERHIRPSVVFRKVTNGFRSDWGAQIHAGYRSRPGTARIQGKPAFDAIRDLIDGKFAVA